VNPPFPIFATDGDSRTCAAPPAIGSAIGRHLALSATLFNSQTHRNQLPPAQSQLRIYDSNSENDDSKLKIFVSTFSNGVTEFEFVDSLNGSHSAGRFAHQMDLLRISLFIATGPEFLSLLRSPDIHMAKSTQVTSTL
jgi:hypothetical protein